MTTSLTLENPVFREFIGYATILILKTLFLGLLTSFYRVTKKIFATEEDVSYFQVKKKGIVLDDPDVERVRRAHQNDLENIPLFVLLGIIYCTTSPALSVALLHFRIFTVARLAHTVVYLFKVPQPARAGAFFTGMCINLSLVFQILFKIAF